jgi:hypothetical protein
MYIRLRCHDARILTQEGGCMVFSISDVVRDIRLHTYKLKLPIELEMNTAVQISKLATGRPTLATLAQQLNGSSLF